MFRDVDFAILDLHFVFRIVRDAEIDLSVLLLAYREWPMTAGMDWSEDDEDECICF